VEFHEFTTCFLLALSVQPRLRISNALTRTPPDSLTTDFFGVRYLAVSGLQELGGLLETLIKLVLGNIPGVAFVFGLGLRGGEITAHLL
jgi:hypothetical protein